jgi:aminoglycoside 2'-N-acetyltransferase I
VVPPEAAGVVTVRHTAHLTEDELAAARAICDLSFDDFGDADWEHALGGMHVLVRDGDTVVAHGALVLRRLLYGGRALRCGYVEAVAVHPDQRRRGRAHEVMTALEALAPAYDLLALCSSRAGRPLYEARGWSRWRGPTGALTPGGPRPTPGEDSIYVLGGPDGLDLDGPLTCDWRDGDVW